MESSKYHPIRDIQRFLQHQPRELQDIALELRNLVSSVAPGATERILWGGLSYYNAVVGGPVKGAICQISMHKDHVRLSFIHGAFLTDPHGLLQGDRKYKKYLKIGSLEHVDWPAVEELIRSAVAFNPSMSA